MKELAGRPWAAFSVLLILAWQAYAAESEDEGLLVLTALPITYSIAASLAQGTSITVENVPEGGRSMNALENLFAQRADRFADQFSRADAVVTIGKLWRNDPLYTAARGANIRVVEIDATKPWSPTLEGVSVAMQPTESGPWEAGGESAREPSVYYWLSLSNAARSVDIVARDLMRLSPADAERVERNLNTLRSELIDLKRDYEVKFAALPNVTVFALAQEFVYLTGDMGIYVDGGVFKQDIDWTDDDRAALTEYLRGHDVPVVIHKWAPDESIVEAIRAGGAELVVLEPIETGLVEQDRVLERSYFRLMQQNLEALHAALRSANFDN